jgi:nucleoside phosphorylase
MGYQNVAIACFPAGEIGIGSAGVMAAEVLRDLPNLRYGLLVGIGAGIPSTENDIRLGDVAVSVPADDNPGIIGYDLVKVEPEELRLKQWQNASHPAIRSAISHIAAKSLSLLSSEPRGINDAPWLSHLGRFKGTRFELPRTPPLTRFSNQQRQPAHAPHIHYGCILSGNRVIKSAHYRDALVKSHNAIAIEMEAAGMMNKLPVGIIRGISDFADAEKNDEWQMYAAASAAAFAKELVICLGPVETLNGLLSSNKLNVLTF